MPSYGLRSTALFLSSAEATPPALVGPIHDVVVDTPFLTLDGDAFLSHYAAGIFYPLADTLDRRYGEPVEWLAGLSRPADVPVEWLAGVVRDYGVSVEWTSPVVLLSRDFGIPVEWLQILQRDLTTWIEWLVSVTRDGSIPVEWFLQLNRDYGIPVEWFIPTFTLTRDFGAPTEWTGLESDTLRITWNVLVKLSTVLPIQWDVVNAGLNKTLPIQWNVLQPLPSLPITWRVLPPLPATATTPFPSSPSAPGAGPTAGQKPFGGVTETP